MNHCYNFIKYTQKLTENNTNNKYIKIRCSKCNSIKPVEGWYHFDCSNNNNYLQYYCSYICYKNIKL